MNAEPVPETANPGSPGPVVLLQIATTAAGLEVLGLVGYGIAIGWSARHGGGKVSAAPVLVVLYLIFAVLLALVARGLRRRRMVARTPFLLAQAFALIVAWTLAHGTGVLPHAMAVVVGVVGALGFGAGVARPMGRFLDR